MEDVIAYALVFAVIVAAVVGIVMLIRAYKRHMTLEAEHKAEVERWVQSERDRMGFKNKPAFKVAASSPRKEEVKKKVDASLSSTTTTNDGFTDGLFAGMMINALTDVVTHKSESSPRVDTSSWGLDDSDSRKSISDSMDTSSWSSSSSDSFSSSDSGPSSDW